MRVRLEERMEVTHRQLVAPDNTHVRDGLAILIQRLDCCDNIVQMLLGQAAAVDREADNVRQLSLCLLYTSRCV